MNTLRHSYLNVSATVTAIFLTWLIPFCVGAQHPVNGAVHRQARADKENLQFANTADYDIIYHRLQLQLQPSVRALQGQVTSYIKPLKSIDTIAFDFSDSMQVTAVNYHGNPAAFIHQGNAIRIVVPGISAIDSVTIAFGGIPASSGFGSFVQDYHGDSVPVLWTLSEPYGARDWWPCKNTLQDKIDSIDEFYTVPTGHLAAGNGLLIDTIQQAGFTTFHWKHRYPITAYLVAVAATNYAAYQDTFITSAGLVYSLNFCYPEDQAEWKTATVNTGRIMALYTQRFGPYPFIKEKYGHAEFSWGGGQEHQTMSFQVNLGFELDAHELAHQWFGDKLTCNSWADIWLNEGFATYCSGLAYENLAPEYWRSFLETRRKQAFRQDSLSVFCTDTSNVGRIFNSAISYSKGAYLLHMLRWLGGDSAFFNAIYDYANDPQLAYSYTKTALLQQHLENRFGHSLQDFFQQWFIGKGYPSYQLLYEKNGSKVKLRLTQTTSDPSVSFFAMPVPVRVYSGKKTTNWILHHQTSDQTFDTLFDGRIDSIVIDPDLWILSRQNIVKRVGSIDQPFVVIYPNPFEDEFTIWYDALAIHDGTFTVYDIHGRKILQGEAPSGNNNYLTIGTTNFERGVYVVEFNSSVLKKRVEIVRR
ncbi:MAG: M1 family aminopeptidase [Chitinophagales bacterium]